jgi:hypothetical protein
MSTMGSYDPFGFLKHKLWPKEGLEVKLAIWIPTTKVANRFDFLTCKWRATYCWKKISKRATTLLSTSFKSNVYTQSYVPPKFWEFQFKEFRDSNLGHLGQNDIWVLAPWPNIKNTVRGKVVATPKTRSWWVLWICVCPWFVHAPKCSNYTLTNL